MKTMTLGEILKVVGGLNILTNAGVGFKDVELSFGIAQFKAEAGKLNDSLQEVLKGLEGTDEEKNDEIKVLLDKEYEIELPTITLDNLKTSEKEIPLVAFDYLQEYIIK